MKKLVKVVTIIAVVMVVTFIGLAVKANGYSFRPTKYSGASECFRAYGDWCRNLAAKSNCSFDELYAEAFYCDNSDEVKYYVLIDGDSNPIGRLYMDGWIKAIDDMDDEAYRLYCEIDYWMYHLGATN